MIGVTNHAIDRFRERFPKLVTNDTYSIINQIKELVDNSVDNFSFLNNTKLMNHLYDKYGFHRKFLFKVQQENDILFVCELKSGKLHIITCFPVPDYIVVHKKFKKPKPQDTYVDSPEEHYNKVNESMTHYTRIKSKKIPKEKIV